MKTFDNPTTRTQTQLEAPSSASAQADATDSTQQYAIESYSASPRATRQTGYLAQGVGAPVRAPIFVDVSGRRTRALRGLGLLMAAATLVALLAVPLSIVFPA